jgi:hypothetical protein
MKLKFLLSFSVVAILLLVLPVSTLAHGTVQVGDYELVIGFHSEPVYQGEPNSLDLFVTNTKTNEKVNGLEDSLQVEIIHGASKKTLKLEPQEDLDGAYTADVIPTATGDYTWHVFGKIGETPVDVSMTSAPDTFNPVEPKSNASFPEAELSSAELSAHTAAAAGTAQTALIIGGIGVVLGLAGLVVGFMGWRAAHRQAG